MTRKGNKQEPPLHLDMDFAEALERFARTKPAEVAASIERAKKKKPPGESPPDGRTPKRREKPRG